LRAPGSVYSALGVDTLP